MPDDKGKEKISLCREEYEKLLAKVADLENKSRENSYVTWHAGYKFAISLRDEEDANSKEDE